MLRAALICMPDSCVLLIALTIVTFSNSLQLTYTFWLLDTKVLSIPWSNCSPLALLL
jgi:hypothetical protein